MSKAFTREDVDPPERSGRVRSASGLPPGAANYITPRGVKRLRDELSKLRSEGDKGERLSELDAILASLTILDPASPDSSGIGFGSTVTLEMAGGETQTFTILGVDELDLEPDALSWISPLGKALLAAELGDRITVGEEKVGKVVKIEYRGS
jgi:transcription elongation factor GreB